MSSASVGSGWRSLTGRQATRRHGPAALLHCKAHRRHSFLDTIFPLWRGSKTFGRPRLTEMLIGGGERLFFSTTFCGKLPVFGSAIDSHRRISADPLPPLTRVARNREGPFNGRKPVSTLEASCRRPSRSQPQIFAARAGVVHFRKKKKEKQRWRGCRRVRRF